MKKIAIATAAVLALLSIAGCANVGKGKAPPPVVTKRLTLTFEMWKEPAHAGPLSLVG